MGNYIDTAEIHKTKLIIIGSGFSGIAAGARIKQEGEDDFIILERSGDVGGVWRDNRYPGCACDVESHLYSFSFAPNPEWSRKFSPQPEILDYLKKCMKDFGLIKHIRFHHEVLRLDWDEAHSEWRIRTNNGEFSAQFVIGAFGALSNPSIPRLNGIESFKGEVFHSADWPVTFNPKGRRIAVIGTGASAIQFIPHLQPHARFLHVFQRTPAWVIPRLDGTISRKRRKLYKQFPLLQKMARLEIYLKREALVLGFRHPKWLKIVEKIAVKHINNAIKNPALLEKLTPRYKIGCKRILLSNTYYPTLSQPNVDVNVHGVSEMTEDAVIDTRGNKVPVDAVIFGTGFQVTELPMAKNIFGRNGHSLLEKWKGSPKAFMGTTIAGFPNFFVLQGPNTGLGHSSVILMIEAQVEHILKALKHVEQNKLTSIEPSIVSQHRFVALTDKLMQGTVWNTGGCHSWYIDETGRNSTLWPGFTFSFKKKAAWWNKKNYIVK